MNVTTDVVQLVLHYSKHIGGVLDILRTELPSEVPVKLPDAVVRYAYSGCYNTLTGICSSRYRWETHPD
jgi:hypothetical protein